MDLYIGHFDVSTTIEDVKFNLEDQQLDIVDLEELQMSHNRFISFKLSIRKKDFEIMQSETFELPEGVVVRKFFPKRSNDGTPITSGNNNGSVWTYSNYSQYP